MHWQIMIFCSTSFNNCLLLLWLVLFWCLFFAFFRTKWNLECKWHVHTGASCSGMFLTFRSDRAEGNTYGESNQGWCLNKRRIRLSAECHRRNVWSDLTMGLTYFFSRDLQEIATKFHMNLHSHCMRQILLDIYSDFCDWTRIVPLSNLVVDQTHLKDCI